MFIPIDIPQLCKNIAKNNHQQKFDFWNSHLLHGVNVQPIKVVASNHPIGIKNLPVQDLEMLEIEMY